LAVVRNDFAPSMKLEPIFGSPPAPASCSVALMMPFVVVQRLRDLGEVGLRRFLGAQHALAWIISASTW